MTDHPTLPSRTIRKRERNRQALLRAASRVMAEKGVDSATMLEIAQAADLAAGTAYNYFKSKEELAMAVLEAMMHDLAIRIETVTATFVDPAQTYAFGVRTLMHIATSDPRWRRLLDRSEVIADALFRRMGPFAIRDLRMAQDAGRFQLDDPALLWRLTSSGIIGFAYHVTTGRLPASAFEDSLTYLLGMTGIGRDEAQKLARQPYPPLPPEISAA